MKNCFGFNRFLLSAAALCVLATSCDNDDEGPGPRIPDASVIGAYAGTGQMIYKAPSEAGDEESDKFAVEARVDKDSLYFDNFPVDVIIRNFFDAETAEGIIGAIGAVDYKISYTEESLSDGKSSELQFAPEVLKIEIPRETEEALKIHITVVSPEKGIYGYDERVLSLALGVTEVAVNGTPVTVLPELTFRFALAKK